MNKSARILLAIGLILAVATPALAEFKLNGYYRLIGYAEEKKAPVKNATIDEEGDSQQFIDQRLRMKANWTLNDNVGIVYFAEVDTTWGENNKAAVGQGGQSYGWTGGSDGVNVETKQVYLDLKSGDTAAQIGIIGVADAFESIVANDDMAGAQVTHKMGDTSFKLVYSKWDEDDSDYKAASAAVDTNLLANGANNERSDWDDFDFYVAEVNQKFSDTFKAGAGVYFMDNNTNDSSSATVGSINSLDYDQEVWFYGLNADAKFGDFGLNGFFMIQDGDREYSNRYSTALTEQQNDVDITGMAASLKGTMKLENGDVGLRVIYFSEDDDDKDNGRWQGFKGQYAFVKENQMQFLTDPYVMNDGKERYAEADAAEAGFGLMAFVLSGNHKLPDNMYVNWGAGYYMAMDDERDDPTGVTVANLGNYREDTDLGYEVCVRIGKKIFEKVDISLNASYAGYGSFYDNTINTVATVDGTGQVVSVTGDDPDATYKTYLMVNVPF